MRRSPATGASAFSRWRERAMSLGSLERAVDRVPNDDVLLTLRLAKTGHRLIGPDPAKGHRRAGTKLGILAPPEEALAVQDVVEEADPAVTAERPVGLEQCHLLGEVRI